MTDTTDNIPDAAPLSTPGRLKIKFRRMPPEGQGPDWRASWEVYGRRLWLFGAYLGCVNAVGADDARRKARERWPNERRLRVHLAPPW